MESYQEQLLEEVRREAYGEDIGQTSWITVDQYDTFYSWLNLPPQAHLLDVASGSGGPALYLARNLVAVLPELTSIKKD